MDRYRPPASYGLLSGFLIQQHLQAMQAEAQRRAEVEDALRFWTWKAVRGFFYLVGGVGALLYFNEGFVWTTAMTVGACATGVFGLLWIFWMGLLDPDFEVRIGVYLWLVSSVAHVAVLIWGWLAYGPATAIPWFFIGLGVLGLVSGLVERRKFLQFWF